MAHQPLNVGFVEELDVGALQLVYDAWKGNPVDKPRLGVAAINVMSYGLGKWLGQPHEGFGAADESDEAIEAAFETAMAPESEGFKAGGIWMMLIAKVAMEILSKLLKS